MIGETVEAEGWVWQRLAVTTEMWVPIKKTDGAEVKIRLPETQSFVTTMAERLAAVGVAGALTNVRKGPKFNDAKAPFTLSSGTGVKLLGYALDPDSDEQFVLRYQVEVEGQEGTFWVPASGIIGTAEVPRTRLKFAYIADAIPQDLPARLKQFGLPLQAVRPPPPSGRIPRRDGSNPLA